MAVLIFSQDYIHIESFEKNFHFLFLEHICSCSVNKLKMMLEGHTCQDDPVESPILMTTRLSPKHSSSPQKLGRVLCLLHEHEKTKSHHLVIHVINWALRDAVHWISVAFFLTLPVCRQCWMENMSGRAFTSETL